ALSRAAMFLVFVSPNAVASQNVRNEINFALNNRKSFLAVYLTETELPVGLQLRMGDIQAIMKHRMSIESYCSKLDKSLPNTLRILTSGDASKGLAANRSPSSGWSNMGSSLTPISRQICFFKVMNYPKKTITKVVKKVLGKSATIRW